MNTAQLQWARTRIRSAAIVNGKYELDVQRETNMGNLLFIPGLTSPVSEIRQLLFGQGQPGGSWIPTLSAAMIAANSFGSGVTDILDLSGNNNPFSQATPSSRGAWFREPKRGRVNLLERTDAIGTSPWSIVGALQIDTGQAAFDGSFNAVRLRKTTTTLQAVFQTIPAGTYCNSIWLRADTVNNIAFTAGSVPNLIINLVNGTVVANTGGVLTSVTVTAFSGGWFRVSYVNASGTCLYMWPTDATSTGTFNTTSAVASVFAYFPQAETGSTPTPYQRVTTAFDVTESGQRDCYGVRFDSVDDGYATAGNVDFSGTNNVTVFAAIRKLSDAAGGNVVLLGTAGSNGFFSMSAPSGPFANVRFDSRGTTTRFVERSVASPAYRILTGEASISSPFVRIRSVLPDGSVATQSNTDSQGTGNYANAVLSISDSLRFNGNLYALIVAGGSYPLSTIQRVERILSRITPTVNL
jgi:hypothetical protein